MIEVDADDPDIKAWVAEHGVPTRSSGTHERLFTEQEDKIILAFWNTSNKRELAQRLGHAEGCVRARYKKLTEQ